MATASAKTVMENRDLTIIGSGAFLAVLCLLFKWAFVARVIVGMLVLVAAMIVALWRSKEDHSNLETYLGRRFGFGSRTRQYTYRGRNMQAPKAAPVMSVSTMAHKDMPMASLEGGTLAIKEFGAYRLLSFFLAVVGIYFIYWMAALGGTQELGRTMQLLFQKAR